MLALNGAYGKCKVRHFILRPNGNSQFKHLQRTRAQDKGKVWQFGSHIIQKSHVS